MYWCAAVLTICNDVLGFHSVYWCADVLTVCNDVLEFSVCTGVLMFLQYALE